ncbi:MAG: hypothetical protein ACKOBL_08890 [Chloroflexota bacterium]
MNTLLLLPVVSALILFGLTQSTENVLTIRQNRRDNGEDVKTYF